MRLLCIILWDNRVKHNFKQKKEGDGNSLYNER